MKKLLPVLFWVITSVILIHAEWITDYKGALIQAKQQNKFVLLDFTGSDWCGYCKLLDKEVFTDASFKNFISKNFVSVTLDFPHETKLSDALTQQNTQLQQQFGIEGFPTLIVVSPDGKELGRMTGYSPGSGPQAVIGKLQGYVKK